MDRIDIYKLSDDCSCSIATEWGCNLMSWRVNGVEQMFCPEGYPAKATKISDGGNPILFPAIGRTWDFSSGKPLAGCYRIHGIDKSFFMPSHGVVYLSRFDKVDETRSGDRTTCVYELTVPEKVRDENYPFDVGLTQSFSLRPDRVDLEMIATNNGDAPAPCAVGYHPYFRISNPLREGVEVRLPVRKHLLMTKDTVLPSGESEDSTGVLALKPDIYYDNLFAEPTGRRMSLIDRKAGRSIHVDCDEKTELFIVYSPDGSDFVCIEPWTRGLGAYGHLNEPGWENGELIPVLQPGESMKFGAAFSVEFEK